jgi:hypothetical protein
MTTMNAPVLWRHLDQRDLDIACRHSEGSQIVHNGFVERALSLHRPSREHRHLNKGVAGPFSRWDGEVGRGMFEEPQRSVPLGHAQHIT